MFWEVVAFYLHLWIILTSLFFFSNFAGLFLEPYENEYQDYF